MFSFRDAVCVELSGFESPDQCPESNIVGVISVAGVTGTKGSGARGRLETAGVVSALLSRLLSFSG